MIYELKFEDRREYCQAKSQLHLLQSYDREYHGLHDIQEVIEISDEEAKSIMLKNPGYDKTDPTDAPEFSLSDAAVGEDFCIIGSTEWA